MPSGLSYRRHLLSAVEALLTHSPEGTRRAQRIVRACTRSLGKWTIDDLAWGPLVTYLRDSVFTTDDNFLAELREKLSRDVFDPQRLYVHYDFLPDMTPSEHELYSSLLTLARLLGPVVPARNDQRLIHDYTAAREEVRVKAKALPSMEKIGQEKLHRVVLTQVANILSCINVSQSVLRYGYWVPNTPYSSVDESDMPPEASDVIARARKMLAAMSGNDRLFVSCQIVGSQVRIVLL